LSEATASDLDAGDVRSSSMLPNTRCQLLISHYPIRRCGDVRSTPFSSRSNRLSV